LEEQKMEIAAKVVDAFLGIFLFDLGILCVLSFSSEALDGIAQVEVRGSGIDSIIDNLRSAIGSLA
jgi:hypothetical protein